MKVTDIHEHIRKLLREKNMTLYQLSKKMEVTPSGLYNMYSRGTMPSIDTLERICNALEITLSDFFIFAGNPKNIGYISDEELAFLEIYRPLSILAKERLKAYAKGSLESETGIKIEK